MWVLGRARIAIFCSFSNSRRRERKSKTLSRSLWLTGNTGRERGYCHAQGLLMGWEPMKSRGSPFQAKALERNTILFCMVIMGFKLVIFWSFWFRRIIQTARARGALVPPVGATDVHGGLYLKLFDSVAQYRQGVSLPFRLSSYWELFLFWFGRIIKAGCTCKSVQPWTYVQKTRYSRVITIGRTPKRKTWKWKSITTNIKTIPSRTDVLGECVQPTSRLVSVIFLWSFVDYYFYDLFRTFWRSTHSASCCPCKHRL
jgi:hypothetical protein